MTEKLPDDLPEWNPVLSNGMTLDEFVERFNAELAKRGRPPVKKAPPPSPEDRNKFTIIFVKKPPQPPGKPAEDTPAATPEKPAD